MHERYYFKQRSVINFPNGKTKNKGREKLQENSRTSRAVTKKLTFCNLKRRAALLENLWATKLYERYYFKQHSLVNFQKKKQKTGAEKKGEKIWRGKLLLPVRLHLPPTLRRPILTCDKRNASSSRQSNQYSSPKKIKPIIKPKTTKQIHFSFP